MPGLLLIVCLGIVLAVQGLFLRDARTASRVLIGAGIVAALVPIVFVIGEHHSSSMAFIETFAPVALIAIPLCDVVAMGTAFTLPRRWSSAGIFITGLLLMTMPAWFVAFFMHF